MRKTYLTFLPVYSEEIADLLKNECVWQVLKQIREAGNEGITADMISANLHESPSTVYAALKQLERVGFIQGMKLRKWLKFWGRPTGEMKNRKDSKGRSIFKKVGKSPKIYFEPCEKSAVRGVRERENPWGDVIFSSCFENEIGKLIRKDKDIESLKMEFLKFMERFYSELLSAKDSDVREVLPDTKDVCKVCKRSHELQEFFKATALFSIANIMDSKEMSALLNKITSEEKSK